MQTHRLKFHPAHPSGVVNGVTVRWGRVKDGRIMLRFRIDGCQQVVLPAATDPTRADDLWKTTCCELFIAGENGTYREFNFSPSGQWAAYAFNGYRTGTGNFDPRQVPEIACDHGNSVLTVTIFLAETELAGATHVSLTAVVEERGGRLSYWAHRHPGEKPDFHNPACFALPVP